MYCASTAVAEADEAKEATVDDQGGGDAPASHKGSEIAVQPSAGSMTKRADVTTSAAAAEQEHTVFETPKNVVRYYCQLQFI